MLPLIRAFFLRLLLVALTATALVTAPPLASAAVEPLTDEQWAAHVEALDEAVEQARRGGRSTEVLYTVDGDGKNWLPWRAEQQRRVAEALYAKGAGAPDEGRAVLTGGLPGAGKTTVLNDNPFVDPSKFLVLSSDDAKEAMCEHDMIPGIEGFAPMETADLIQYEAAHITRMVAERAYRERKNVIWDTTMASVGSIDGRLAPLRAAGYGDVDALFLDVPIEVSVQRVDRRHRVGYERYRNGARCEGRHVPESFVRKHEHPFWGSTNRQSFEATKSRYDDWYLYDAAVLPPRLVDQS
ncbi:zeta toxin family protein [Actinosynnema sp. CA-248983]